MSTRRNRQSRVAALPKRDMTQIKGGKLAYFSIGPASLQAVRPHSALPSKDSQNQKESAELYGRPRTAPSTKIVHRVKEEISLTPPTPRERKGRRRSHQKQAPKEALDESLGLNLFDFTSKSSDDTSRRSSQINTQHFDFSSYILRDSPHDKDHKPVTTERKEAWTQPITTIVVSPPEEPLGSEQEPTKKFSFETWLSGPDIDSDEFDTDLEDDFPKAPDKPIDPTGQYIYEEECQKLGIVPVSYIARHLGDRHLGMRHHYLGGKRTIPIAEALKTNTVTETLDLTDNYIEGCGAWYLAEMVNKNLFIVSLNLSNNFLKTEGARAIADMLETNTTLRSLSLSGNQLTDLDCHLFVEALKHNVSLMSLDLSHNEIGESGATWLAAALAVNEGLTELDLSWNAIRQKGAGAFGLALVKNKFLEVFDLSWNGLGTHGAAGLAKGLQGNTKLKVLDLTNNRLDSRAMVKFCPYLRKNYGIETLLLNLNPVTEAGLEILLKAAVVHPALKFLSVEKCALREVVVTPSIFAKICELEERKNLIIVHGDVTGYQRFTAHRSVVKLFRRFLQSNQSLLELTLRQQDKGREGVVSVDELKHAFREAGFRLTNKQLDLLIEEGDLLKNGNIDYSGLIDGSVFGN
ncbi:leucine-rich repeat-containing protein 74B-like [Liolophura sinensis]|uniref:leucine-rich repeat-containing protein 74B-like n=1 Tax=Liolophura sinensis TaxID=3198878 RepID=UPI0031595067